MGEIRRAECLRDRSGCQTERGQTDRIERHVHLARETAVFFNRRDPRDRPDGLDDALRGIVKLTAIVTSTVQGQRHDRNVIDAQRRDLRLRGTRRQFAQMRGDLVVEIDERFRRIVADVKEHGEDRCVLTRDCVHVLDARNLLQHAFGALGDELLHFRCRRAGILRDDRCRRHRDLRILLARRDEDRDESPRADRDDDDRGELGFEEIGRNASGKILRHQRRTVTRLRSSSRSTPLTATTVARPSIPSSSTPAASTVPGCSGMKNAVSFRTTKTPL